jgi:photosystem II stability/assembly factor-like uncharacterized protein
MSGMFGMSGARWATDAGSRTRRSTGRGRSRGRALITAVAVSAVLAGCGAAAPAGGRTAAARPAAATPTTAPQDVNSDEYADLMDLAGSGLGLVGLGSGPQGTGAARLVASADFGRSFAAIGPPTAAGTATDDVFFLSRQDGWYAVFNAGTEDETLYRTTDGGRTWSAFAAPGHDLGGLGTGDTLQFLTPERGWLTDTEGTAPEEALYATTDGGERWRLVASIFGHLRAPGALPDLGRVQFEPGGKVGWIGGACSRALYRTTDGGLAWHHSAIAAPAGAAFGLPAGSGQTLLEPVILVNGTLVLYRSSDGGARWSRVAALSGAVTGATGGAGGCGDSTVSVSFPSAQDGWAAAGYGARTVAYRTTDGGHHWEPTVGSLPGEADTQLSPVISAIDATHAWLLTPGGQLYATVNGGTTWRRIDTAAIAAGS